MRRRKAGRTAVLVSATLASLLAAAAAPPSGSASQLIERYAESPSLMVNAKGEALLTYRKNGKTQYVLAWGAVNAIAPTESRPQVKFELDYKGGWGKYRDAGYAKQFTNVCRPYAGPALAWFVAGCTAPDGSHWVLQAWQRMLPNFGVKPARAAQAAWELRLSHWTGEIAQLVVHRNWAYRKFDHIFGIFTYRGLPVYGFRTTPTGDPLDTYGRNLYVDTYNSAYGPGWKRDFSFLMHNPTGMFCYGFYKHGRHPSGMGEKYRATIIGPGVTPDVMVEWVPLGPYDQARDVEIHEQQKAFLASDPLCKPV